MSAPLKLLARRRREYVAAGEEHHRRFMDALVDAIAAGDKVNVRELAREAGIAHGTVYNELARRQDRADQLSANGDVPAPAPHDDDQDAGLEAPPKISPTMRAALEAIAAGEVRVTGELDVRSSAAGVWPTWATLDALERRGLIESPRSGLTVKATRVGRELVERGGRA